MTIIEDKGETWTETHQVIAVIDATTFSSNTVTLDRPGTFLAAAVYQDISPSLAGDAMRPPLLEKTDNTALLTGDNITALLAGIQNADAATRTFTLNIVIWMRKAR